MSLLVRLLSFLVWLPVVLLWVALWPFGVLYHFALCVVATYTLVKKGQDVLVVQNTGGDASTSSLRLQELCLSEERLVLLDYANHKQWPWRSLPARLFWAFGPIPMPPRFTPDFLPAVLLLKPFRFPMAFSFGRRSKDTDSRFAELLAALKSS
jgi:hypothetical protein